MSGKPVRGVVKEAIQDELTVGWEDGAPVDEIADRILCRLFVTKTRNQVEQLLSEEAAGVETART